MKEPLLYRILRPLLTFFMYVVFHPKVIGKENIPKEGKVILAGNHTSYFDPVLLIATNKRVVHFLAKYELTKGPLGFIFKRLEIIPVNRQTTNKNALDTSINYLNNEKMIGIFPEATINRTNDVIMPFKRGAVKMAVSTKAPIVPFSITGKYRVFGHSVTIVFEKPYKVKSDNLKEEKSILEEKISKMILERR